MASETNAGQDSISKHWECLTAAATDVFGSTCGVALQPQEGEEAAKENLILAVIALVGEVEWSVFLGLPGGTATAVASKFAGFEIPFESADMGDAIGEVTNILAGKVKALLHERGVKTEISLPTVLRANGLEVLVQQKRACGKICYGSPMGRLWAGIIAGKTPGLLA